MLRNLQGVKGTVSQLSISVQRCFVMVSSVATLGLLVASSAIAQDQLPTESERPSFTEELAEAPTSEAPISEAPTPDDELDVSIAKDSLRLTPLFRVGANTESGGIPASLTAFDGFFPLRQSPGHNVTFLNTRLNIDFDDEDTLGGTLLFGHRSYSSERERILGGYLSLDVRDTGEATFPQIGFGFERLGNYWDIRANGYVPVGDTRQRIDRDIFTSSESTVDIGDATFNGNLLSSTFTTTTTDVFTQVDRFEAALGGFDVEAGTRLARWNEHGELRLYGGVYYLAGHDVSAVGGRGRIEIAPVESIRLMAGIQGDPVFDVRGFFGASFLFPTPAPLKAEVDPDKREEAIAALGETVTRLADPVARDFNVVVDEQREVESTTTVTTITEEVPFVNPATGEPWRFTHVATGGSSDGTFEDPFGLLQEGLDATVGDGNDIVYVALPDDATVDPFTVPDNVQVLSTGPEQELDATLAGTSITSVVLPGSNDGNFPDVTDTVTAGSDSKLSGFDITGATGSAMVVPTGTTGSVEISDNTLTSPVDDGIEIEEITGDLELFIASNTIDGTYDSAIDFDDISSGTVEVRIQENILQNAVDDGIDLDDVVGSAVVDVEITDNTIANVDQGIEFGDFRDQSEATIAIANNEISETYSDGIEIGSIEGDAVVEFSIRDNTIEGAGDDGIIFSEIYGSAQVDIDITGNTIIGSSYNGIYFAGYIADESVVDITISDNSISESGADGISFYAIQDNAEVTVAINNNTITDSDNNGISFDDFENYAAVNVEISDNTISDNGDDGIDFDSSQYYADIDIFIRRNTISMNGSNGIYFDDIEDYSTVDIEISDNTISDNEDRGIYFTYIEDDAVVGIDIVGNTIDGNGSDGIFFGDFENDTIVTVTIEDNSVINNGDDGIQIRRAEDNSTATITFANNIISGNEADGIRLNFIESSTVNLTIDGNTLEENDGVGSGNRGISIDSSSDSLTAIVTDNESNQNGANGIRIANLAGGSTCLQLDGNSATSNAFADFRLINNDIATAFEIVELSNITVVNSGDFVPADPAGSGLFTDVASCTP